MSSSDNIKYCEFDHINLPTFDPKVIQMIESTQISDIESLPDILLKYLELHDDGRFDQVTFKLLFLVLHDFDI
jgi:hypothetical protein